LDINKDIVTKKIDDLVFSEVLENVKKAVELKNYRIAKVVNVDNIFERLKGAEKARVAYKYYKIVEICNLFTCNEIISADLRAGVFMPIRITVYEPKDEEAVYVSFLKPTAFAELFSSPKMKAAALKLEKDLHYVLSSSDF
jgi:uncharacterized protein (DUF302 family)